MATRTCAADGVEFSVGAPGCPQCGSTRHYETGSPDHLAAVEAAIEAERENAARSKRAPKPASTNTSATAADEGAE
jgi:hypothetical protein